MLLLDLPQERGWRRIRDQHHGPSRHFSRADTLKVKGKRALGVWNAPIDGHKGSADRHYCKHCGTPLWVSDKQWPELVHPFASAIDTELPKAPSSAHLLLRDKASWVEPQAGPHDDCFDGYPELSIEDWHRKHGLWIE